MLESQIVVGVGDNLNRVHLYSFTFRQIGMQTQLLSVFCDMFRLQTNSGLL